jgi:hypothetical protein
MLQTTCYLTTDTALIATPDCFGNSARTQELKFFEFAESYDLQSEAQLGSCVFIQPHVNWVKPLTGTKLHEAVANFLANIKRDSRSQQLVFENLMANPNIKILWLNREPTT